MSLNITQPDRKHPYLLTFFKKCVLSNNNNKNYKNMILSVECRGIRFYCSMFGNSQVYGRRHGRIICHIRVNENDQYDVQYGHLCGDCLRDLSLRSHRMPPITARAGVSLESIVMRMAPRLSQTRIIRRCAQPRYNDLIYYF